jgi:hypothetical protein
MRSLSYANLIYYSLGLIGLLLSIGIVSAWRARRNRQQTESPVSPEYLLQELEHLRLALAEIKIQLQNQERSLRRLQQPLPIPTAATPLARADEPLITHAPLQSRSAFERRYQVIKLARQGLDDEEIASRLKMPHGEVRLILGLRSMQQSLGASA